VVSAGFLAFMEHLPMSSQNTSGGIERNWDPMSARVSASSLLPLLIC
jgi:hypothetical protein